MQHPSGGAKHGLGFRPELAGQLLARPQLVDFVEVVAETCYTQRATRREAAALAEIWPVVPHGVKLSLGSAEGVDADRVARLAALARELRAEVVSEHVAFTRAGGVDIGHLTQLPRTREAIRAVARNVARVRRALPPDARLLLENVAWSVLWPDDEMDEASFYQEIVAATGCELLLDVGNLYANARNEGLDPRAVIARYPLERVGMLHVAGGVTEHGFYFDTHAHPIPPAVLELVAHVVARRPDVPVMIERDAGFDGADLEGELAALRALPRGGAAGGPATGEDSGARAFRACASDGPDDEAASAALVAAQAELARQLAGRGAPDAPLARQIGAPSLDRARGILQRKRVDDALPLLVHLSRGSDRVRDVATAALAATLRPPRGAGPSDAWRIAEAALRDPELANAAAIDRLLLRARFAGPDASGALRPRRAPFLGSARLDDGRRVRATKGLGALAQVRMHERRG